jgi:predicted site-specific integrase-resolvase
VTESYWLDLRHAAARAGMHYQTLRVAASDGELHGYQRVVAGKWRFRPECVDAWVAGEKCEHQRVRRVS